MLTRQKLEEMCAEKGLFGKMEETCLKALALAGIAKENVDAVEVRACVCACHVSSYSIAGLGVKFHMGMCICFTYIYIYIYIYICIHTYFRHPHNDHDTKKCKKTQRNNGTPEIILS